MESRRCKNKEEEEAETRKKRENGGRRKQASAHEGKEKPVQSFKGLMCDFVCGLICRLFLNFCPDIKMTSVKKSEDIPI